MVLLTLTLTLGDRERWSLQVLCQCYLHSEFQAGNSYNERPCARSWKHHKCTFHSYRDKMFNITGVPCSSCWGLWLSMYLVNFDYSDNFRYSCINSSMLSSSCYVCFCKPPSSTKQTKTKTSSSIVHQVNQYCLLSVWQFHTRRVQTSSSSCLVMIPASLKVKTNAWLSILSSCKHPKLSSTKGVSFILSSVWPKSKKVQSFHHLVFLSRPFQI